jgi:hypothetical protein
VLLTHLLWFACLVWTFKFGCILSSVIVFPVMFLIGLARDQRALLAYVENRCFRVIGAIEQRFPRVGQLLQRCAGAAQILGALAREFDGVRRFLFLVLLDAQLRKIAQGGFVGWPVLFLVVCYEHRWSTRRCATVREMDENP